MNDYQKLRDKIEAGLNVQNAEAKLWALLTGLECQKVDEFLARADTESYLRFGRVYATRAKELIAQSAESIATPDGDAVIEAAREAALVKLTGVDSITELEGAEIMFSRKVAEGMFDAGYEYEPPDDPEFNALLRKAIENINDKYRKEGYDAAIAQTQKAAQPAESDVCECGHIAEDHWCKDGGIEYHGECYENASCNCTAYRPADVPAKSEPQNECEEIDAIRAMLWKPKKQVPATQEGELRQVRGERWTDADLDVAMKDAIDLARQFERQKIAKELQELDIQFTDDRMVREFQEYIDNLESGKGK